MVIADAATVSEGRDLTFTVTLQGNGGSPYAGTEQAKVVTTLALELVLSKGANATSLTSADLDLVGGGWTKFSEDASTETWRLSNITLPPGQLSTNVTLKTLADATAEQLETVILRVAAGTVQNANGLFVDTDTGAGAIADVPPAGIVVGDAVAVAEGGTLAFGITLTGPNNGSYLATEQSKVATHVSLSFFVALDAAAGLSVADLDNAALTGTGAYGGWTRTDNPTTGIATYTKTITIPANTASVTVSIPTLIDSITAEATETLTLSIAGGPSGNGVTNANGMFAVNDGSGLGAITNVAPQADTVDAVANQVTSAELQALGWSRPTLDTNAILHRSFTVETGSAAIGDDDLANPDLGGFAPVSGAPTFRITSLPTFGQLYIDTNPTNGNVSDWQRVTQADVTAGNSNVRFGPNAVLHWVLTDKDAPVPSASTKPSFTYVAIDGTTESAPAEVLIETPIIADPVRTGDDQIPTLAGFIDPATGQPHQILTFKKLDIGGVKENNGAADPLGPLDGDITVREPGSSGGDPADLGGFAMQSEDGLGFYLTSLPATGKLYYKGADQLGNGSGLTEITAANLLNATGSNLATALKLNTGQELYWITTGADLTKQAPVTIGGQNLTLNQWENPTGGNGLTVDITAFGFDGQEAFIVTQNNTQGVKGSDGTLSGKTTTFMKGGIGVQGEAPNVPFQAPDWEAELGRGYGSYFGTSEKLRFAFSQAIASTTIQVSHLYQPEGEIGVVDLCYQGRFVDRPPSSGPVRMLVHGRA